jgi:hypothetical protein
MFQESVLRITGLPETDRQGISKLMAHVRRNYDKFMQVSPTSKARRMVPHVRQEPLLQETWKNGPVSRTATMMCLPYFDLKKYSRTLADFNSASHPTRTLLQARFSLTPKQRDMKQAVCQLFATPPEHCFHIAQMWCLVLDNSECCFICSCIGNELNRIALLVTCSRMPMVALQGEIISVVPGPTKTIPGSQSPTILVSSKKSLLWSFHVDECRSWLVNIMSLSRFILSSDF